LLISLKLSTCETTFLYIIEIAVTIMLGV
jgi:hypothetical protein